MVDQICVDGILKVPATEVGQEDVDRLLDPVVLRIAADGGGPATPRVGRDGVVDRFDDVWVGEELIGFHFFHSALNGFLAEGTYNEEGEGFVSPTQPTNKTGYPCLAEKREGKRGQWVGEFLQRIFLSA